MADFSNIIQEINADINTNGAGEITGAKLNEVLRDMISAVNAAKQDPMTIDATPTEDSTNPVQSGGVYNELSDKQDTISDLADIRSGAELGATAYQKPSTGIPSTDLASGVQTSLGKADTAVQQVTVGTTTTGNAGTNASVTNSGTVTNPVLDFTIPRGADGADGQDGADAVNPFKGWWPDLATLKTAHTATAGDSAYVKDASPATTWSIYVYDSTASSDNYWADSGTDADTSNVQTFASGEEVNEVHIVNDLTTGGINDVLSAEQGKVIGEMIGTPITTILPTSYWAEKSWNSYSGTDGIFWDIRNVISNNRKLKSIHLVNEQPSGTIRIHYLDASFNSVAYEDHEIGWYGVQTIIPTTDIDYSQPLYVGFQNISTKIKIVYPTDGSGQTRKKFLSDGHIVEQTYPYALWIDVEDSSDTLPVKVDSLEKQVLGMDTIEEYLINGVKDIRLKPQEYVLSETITIPSGVKISGVLGRTVISVPSTIKIGFQLKNVTDVTIEGITIQGAYNGTPIVNSMQPVRGGIVDTVDNAKSLNGIGYQTDMTNGGVTSEYIPQIGINIYGCEKLNISNCEIRNFSYYGICNGLSGKNYRYACRFIGNYINNCYCGLHTYNEAERSQYYGNTISLCQIGVHLDSGTNMFTDNAFNANNIGMMMTNGVNHAHGFQKGNAYTHCTLFNLLAIDIQYGEIFSDCKFGYVEEKEGNTYGGVSMAVVIMNSRGMFFDSCYFFSRSYFAFIGKFNKEYSGYTIGTADVFGNTPYVVTYTTVENGNGVNKICDGNYGYNYSYCVYFEGEGVTDGVYVVRKDNINREGTGSNYLNSPS